MSEFGRNLILAGLLLALIGGGWTLALVQADGTDVNTGPSSRRSRSSASV
ncbi:hypothetical protein [Streptomyces umbrinus]|nr:hypothetical protein [Streptomyces umbrinus]